MQSDFGYAFPGANRNELHEYQVKVLGPVVDENFGEADEEEDDESSSFEPPLPEVLPDALLFLLLGDRRSGKSDLARIFCRDSERNTQHLEVFGNMKKIQIVDLDSLSFSCRRELVPRAKGFILVYDVACPGTFETLKLLYDQIESSTHPPRHVMIFENAGSSLADDAELRETVENFAQEKGFKPWPARQSSESIEQTRLKIDAAFRWFIQSLSRVSKFQSRMCASHPFVPPAILPSYQISIQIGTARNFNSGLWGSASLFLRFGLEGREEVVESKAVKKSPKAAWNETVQIPGYFIGSDLLKIFLCKTRGPAEQPTIEGTDKVWLRTVSLGRPMSIPINFTKIDKRHSAGPRSKPVVCGSTDIAISLTPGPNAQFPTDVYTATISKVSINEPKESLGDVLVCVSLGLNPKSQEANLNLTKTGTKLECAGGIH